MTQATTQRAALLGVEHEPPHQQAPRRWPDHGQLVLGGGYGPLTGRFGLAADNLLGAEVVLADGSRVDTDAEREPDLFWALRGGGGNFGVVTSARLRLHPMPTVVSGTILYPITQAARLLADLGEVLRNSPDELTTDVGFLPGPDGDPVVYVAPTWSGNLDEGASPSRTGICAGPSNCTRRSSRTRSRVDT